MKMGKHAAKPERKLSVKKFIMLEIAVILLAVAILGSLKVYAVNQCVEMGIPQAVYSIPSGASCEISIDGLLYLVPLEEVQNSMRHVPPGNGV